MKNYSTRNLQADFYPATGYRNSTNGYLGNMGAVGYGWNSAPLSAASVKAANLDISSNHVNPDSGGDRAFGLPVRCVQE